MSGKLGLQRLLDAASADPSEAWAQPKSRHCTKRTTANVMQHQTHVEEALANMSIHQHAILSALREGDTAAAALRQPEYRAKERSYKGACRVQCEVHKMARIRFQANAAQAEQTGDEAEGRGHHTYPTLAALSTAQRLRSTVSARRLLPAQDYDLPSEAVRRERESDFASKRPGNRGRGVLERMAARKESAATSAAIRAAANPQAKRLADDADDGESPAGPPPDPTSPPTGPPVAPPTAGLHTPGPTVRGGVTGEALSDSALRRAFEEADTDGSGRVSTSELAHWLRTRAEFFGLPHGPADVERALRYAGGVGSRWCNPNRLRARPAGELDDVVPLPPQADGSLPPLPTSLGFDEFAAVSLALAAH